MKSYLFLSLLLVGVQGFAPSLRPSVAFSSRSITPLFAIIRADAEDFKIDPAIERTVKQTEDNAIKLLGDVKHKPGSATPGCSGLLRYSQVIEVKDSVVKDIMAKAGATLIATGQGQEDYKDPGETTVKEVILGPPTAVRDAFMGAGDVTQANHLVINFLGGDDLMFDEVCDAMAELVLELSPPTKTTISYNSLCHQSFPMGSATVTVVATTGPPTGEGELGMSDVERSVANGEVYFREEKWWSVAEEDVVPEDPITEEDMKLFEEMYGAEVPE